MRTTKAARVDADQQDFAPEGFEYQAARRSWLDFAAFLARKNLLRADLVTTAREAALSSAKIRALFPSTHLAADQYADEVAEFFRIPRLRLRELLASEPLTNDFSTKFLRENTIFPCVIEGGRRILVLADPTDEAAIQGAELVFGSSATLATASFDDIATALAASEKFGAGDADQSPSLAPGAIEDVDGLRDLASGAPVVNAVNDLFERALQLRATDIHIEPFRAGCNIRFRIDGLMRLAPTRSNVVPEALISRIKILAALNIAERRLPQDGAAHVHVAGQSIDFRAATMPTKFGESAVIRLLPQNQGLLDFAKLGLAQSDHNRLMELLQLPHGLIVVTGPTGSGKTTTLATILNQLNDETRKILTIEDPIEYEIAGINQSQVRPEIGLTFAAALRSFVRQDPDVIMLGEIRDPETAKIAIHAALTGHLVLTTLHTENAAAAIPRLIDLGVEPFLLQSTLRGVIAQRLARVLCDGCKRDTALTEETLEADPRYRLLGFGPGEHVHDPQGCERCSGTGYRGRVGLFEILRTTKAIRELIASRSDASTIAVAAREFEMTALIEDGASKCRHGLTSVQEVLRVATLG